MFQLIIFLLTFMVFAVLMYLKRLPAFLALPLMAVILAGVAQISLPDILQIVIAQGSVRLYLPIMVVIFGAMLSQFMNNAGIAESLIKKAAELAGDKIFSVSALLSLAVALLFTVLGGLGAVIMVASIVLPVMLSIGLTPLAAGAIFLMGLSLGGVFNLANWQLYMSILNLSQSEIFSYALCLGAAFLAVFIFFIWVQAGPLKKGIHLCSQRKPQDTSRVSWYALLTPVIPIALVFGFSFTSFEFPILTALILGLVYGVLTVAGKWQERINLLSKSMFEGISAVAPAMVLIIGIGMLLNAVLHPNVVKLLAPFLTQIMPVTRISYILFFVLLAPLTLYRGPLNLWGMGSGIIGLMLITRTIPPVAIMAALMAVGQIQGVCDPTNTHNVWIANFLNVNVQDILRKTIFYMWVLALVGLVVAGFIYF